MKKILSVLLVMMIVLGACSTTSSNDKVKIVTTIYPIYDMVYTQLKDQEDKYEIVNIYPEGADPHSYELTPQNIKDINDSDFAFYISDEFETFMKDVETKGHKVAVTSHDEHSEEEEHAEEDHEEHDHSDEHLWISPEHAIEINSVIGDELCENESFDCDKLKSNMGTLNGKLGELTSKYEKEGSESSKTIYTSHDAFSVLKDFGFDIVGIYGAHHDDEPSSSDIANIITDIKENSIKYIYGEQNEQHSDVINQISSESGADILELNNMTTISEKDMNDHVSILDMYEYNLKQLGKIND